MAERIGKNTVLFSARPRVLGHAAVGGKKESEGPLASEFDRVYTDDTLGEDTWEQAESRLVREAFTAALEKAGIAAAELHAVFAGDLLNQCIASTFGLREFSLPFVGQFGACSTMAQTLLAAATFVDGGAADVCAAVTSSHFCTAERQFRFPLEYGGQRTPTSQWTATAAGAAIVGLGGRGARIADGCVGRVVDLGVTDMNNMGAAMAPAAADTLSRYFHDTDTKPTDYEAIVTGDLSAVGGALLRQLLKKEGFDLSDRYTDCGLLLYDRQTQDVHAGGSGCGCSAGVLCGHLLNRVDRGELSDFLFVGTGALMSPTSCQQGESIPAVAHLVHFVND